MSCMDDGWNRSTPVTNLRIRQQLFEVEDEIEPYPTGLQLRRIQDGRRSGDVRRQGVHFIGGDDSGKALQGRRRMEIGAEGRHVSGSRRGGRDGVQGKVDDWSQNVVWKYSEEIQFRLLSKSCRPLIHIQNRTCPSSFAIISLGVIALINKYSFVLHAVILLEILDKAPSTYDNRTGWGEGGSPKSRQNQMRGEGSDQFLHPHFRMYTSAVL